MHRGGGSTSSPRNRDASSGGRCCSRSSVSCRSPRSASGSRSRSARWSTLSSPRTRLGQLTLHPHRRQADPAKAQEDVNSGLEALTNKRLDDATIAGAFKNLTFTLDPIASSLQTSADHAEAVGLLEPVDLTSPGIYDLTLLNKVLAARGDAEATGL